MHNKAVNIEFDKAKDEANLAKHGVSLAAASDLSWSDALYWVDARKTYAEAREVALAPLGDRLFCCVYVDRGAVRRVISLRKANKREFRRYEKETDSAD